LFDGGSVLAVHHGLYNEDYDDMGSIQNKDLITNDLFGVISTPIGFTGTLTSYTLYQTNYGHFISTYGLSLAQHNLPLETPFSWSTDEPLNGSNLSYSFYQSFDLYDEIYGNLTLLGNSGRGINEITPLFSNELTPTSQMHLSGFYKYYNSNDDELVGKLVYLQPGERKENYESGSLHGQVIRNAVIWLTR
jgi:hypothetical protein